MQIASNVGYGEFGDWVDSLDAKTYGELIHLYEHGWSQDIADLIGQLDAAIKDEPPKKADVLDVATTLAEYLKGEEKAIVATITDGLGDGEDDSTKSVKEVAHAPAGSPIGGQFISGGGASGAASSAGHVMGSDGGRLMRLVELPVKLEHAVTHAITHAAKEAVSYIASIWSDGGAVQSAQSAAHGSIIGKVGGGANLLAKGGMKAAFASWVVGNKAVELVARAKGFIVKGLSEPEIARVKGICAGYDVLACKAVFLGLEHSGIPALQHLAAPSTFIPMASAAYLAYSTATNPVAVIKAAKDAVKSVADKFREKPKAFDPTDTKAAVAKLCDAAKKHAGEDYFFAALCEAIEETGEHGGDISDAIELAEEAAKAKS